MLFGIDLRPADQFPLDDTGAPLYQEHLRGQVDYRAVSCPESERAALHENIWIFHQTFLGTEQDTDDIADAIEKVITNLDELKPTKKGGAK